jgi:sRNA-binding carbon storage regulator CsrA
MLIYNFSKKDNRMNLDELVYQDIIVISGIEHKGNRDIKANKITIPYTDEPDVGIDDIIKIKLGQRENDYKVLDCKFMKNGTLKIGTQHPHMLTLVVKDNATQEKNNIPSSIFNIGAINGEQFQIGNNNIQTINITLKELVERISKTNDNEAKNLLKKILENSTIAGIIGAGASVLFGTL